MSVKESDWEWETLTEEQIEFCRKIANKRRENADENKRQQKNNAPTDLASRISAEELGLLGEGASVRYLKRKLVPVKWNYYRENGISGLPDIEAIEVSIDAKARRLNHYDLCVQIDDPAHWVYILARCELRPKIALVGWCWGHEAQAHPITDPAGERPAHFVPEYAPCMKPMHLLVAELFKRRNQARIGFVGTDKFGLFVHYCKICGADAGLGHGVDVRHGKLGTWFCLEHNPA